MIQVWTEKDKSGVLNRTDSAWRFAFTYDPRIGAESAVSLTMPVRPESWMYNGSLHPIFDMNLPEGALRHWLERSFAKVIERFDDLEMLKITGCSQIGRIRYSSFGQDLAKEDVPTISVKSLLMHRGADDLFEDLLRMYATFSGVSGVQPKVMVRVEEAREALVNSPRLTVKAPTHIVKTWTEEYPELALNEFLCLKAAERSGLPTATAQLSEDRRFLIVERFDLKGDGRFIGFEDCCALQGQPAKRKYDSSYEKVSKSISDFSPEDFEVKRNTMRTLLGIVALSVLVRNGDAHLKNFGLLYDSPETRRGTISPAYDIVSTVPYVPKDLMALMLGGTKRWPDRRKLEGFGKRNCNLPAADVVEVMDAVAEGVSATLSEIKRWMSDAPAFREVGERMLTAWREGLASLG